MAPVKVVILGAGFGGLEVAARLSAEAPADVDVTLIDRSDSFVFGFSKLDVLFGRTTLPQVRAYYREIAKPSVAFRQETVTSIDPVARRVRTEQTTYDADVLVIALGADLDPGATPGLLEGGHEFYSLEGTARLASVLPSFTSGHAVIGVAGTPFKCPPAPSEAAFMLHDHLTARGLRDRVRITVVSPLPTPVPPSPATSRAILDGFAERGITYRGGQTVAGLDVGARTVEVRGGDRLDYDLFLGVPIHRAPQVVLDSGLTDGGWVAVEPTTLRTPYPGVYALGDVANAPVPRAGVFAERAAGVVADQILAEIRGGDVVGYDGYGMCYIEFGDGRVGRVEVTFITANGPQGGPFTPPSAELTAEKEQFATTRLQRWFGREPVAAAGDRAGLV